MLWTARLPLLHPVDFRLAALIAWSVHFRHAFGAASLSSTRPPLDSPATLSTGVSIFPVVVFTIPYCFFFPFCFLMCIAEEEIPLFGHTWVTLSRSNTKTMELAKKGGPCVRMCFFSFLLVLGSLSQGNERSMAEMAWEG